LKKSKKAMILLHARLQRQWNEYLAYVIEKKIKKNNEIATCTFAMKINNVSCSSD
jgi:hypothetical protein